MKSAVLMAMAPQNRNLSTVWTVWLLAVGHFPSLPPGPTARRPVLVLHIWWTPSRPPGLPSESKQGCREPSQTPVTNNNILQSRKAVGVLIFDTPCLLYDETLNRGGALLHRAVALSYLLLQEEPYRKKNQQKYFITKIIYRNYMICFIYDILTFFNSNYLDSTTLTLTSKLSNLIERNNTDLWDSCRSDLYKVILPSHSTKYKFVWSALRARPTVVASSSIILCLLVMCPVISVNTDALHSLAEY